MAVRHAAWEDSSADYLTRTSGPTATSFSACWWAVALSWPGTGYYGGLLSQGDNVCAAFIGTDNGFLENSLCDGGNTYGSELTVGTWYHFGWVRSAAGGHIGYLNGVVDYTRASTNSSTSWNCLSTFTTGYNTGNLKMAHLKMWDNVQLTQAEIQQEMLIARPVRISNLWGWYPFVGSNVLDQSGNGRNWTLHGSLALEDGPPVGWGARPLIVGAGAAGGGATVTQISVLSASAQILVPGWVGVPPGIGSITPTITL